MIRTCNKREFPQWSGIGELLVETATCGVVDASLKFECHLAVVVVVVVHSMDGIGFSMPKSISDVPRSNGMWNLHMPEQKGRFSVKKKLDLWISEHNFSLSSPKKFYVMSHTLWPKLFVGNTPYYWSLNEVEKLLLS